MLEGLRQSREQILSSLQKYKGRYVLALAATAAVGNLLYESVRPGSPIFPKPGFCSEVSDLIPNPSDITGNYTFTAGNTNGGLLDAPVRSLFATSEGILVGHSSTSAPDSTNPINPVRYLTAAGWEICTGRPSIKGSVNAVFQNSETKEIFAVKDTEDPNTKPGSVVSIFDGRKWSNYGYIPGILDYRGYAAMRHGRETWIGTYDGVAVWKDDKTWGRPVKELDIHSPVHALLETFNISVPTFSLHIWYGLLHNGVKGYSVPSNVTEQPGVPRNIRALEVSADRYSQIWVGADPGLGYFDGRNKFLWTPVTLPDGVSQVMAIRMNPATGLPCAATLDKNGGVFCFDGIAFNRISTGPSLSLEFGKPGSAFEGKMFVGTENNGLLQFPAPG